MPLGAGRDGGKPYLPMALKRVVEEANLIRRDHPLGIPKDIHKRLQFCFDALLLRDELIEPSIASNGHTQNRHLIRRTFFCLNLTTAI